MICQAHVKCLHHMMSIWYDKSIRHVNYENNNLACYRRSLEKRLYTEFKCMALKFQGMLQQAPDMRMAFNLCVVTSIFKYLNMHSKQILKNKIYLPAFFQDNV